MLKFFTGLLGALVGFWLGLVFVATFTSNHEKVRVMTVSLVTAAIVSALFIMLLNKIKHKRIRKILTVVICLFSCSAFWLTLKNINAI